MKVKKAVEAKFDNLILDDKIKSIPLSDDDFQSLITFFVTGKYMFGKPKPISDRKLYPVHFKKWREEGSLQNFPICFLEKNPERISASLNEIFDTSISENVHEKKDNENNVLWDLKFHINSHLNGFSEEFMSKLWDKSVKSLFENFKKPEEKSDVEKTIKSIEKRLDLSGKVAGLSQNIANIYFNTALKKAWIEKLKSFANTVNGTVDNLAGLIESDKNKAVGKSAKNLKSTVGDTYEDSLDFEALSHILESSFVESSLPANRIERIKKIIKRLISFNKYYSGFVTETSNIELFNSKGRSLKEALKQFDIYQKSVVDFFCALHMANLEMANKYKEDKHDTIFEDFHFSYLTEEDISNIPPFPICVNGSQADENFQLLTQLLETEFPVKIILEVNDLVDFKKSDAHTVKTFSWTRKLVSMAINLNDIFIMQTNSYDLPRDEKKILHGLNFKGPALFCFFNIHDKTYSDIDQHLMYNAVSNSRAFPSWTYNPNQQQNLASRFDISLNPDPDKDWSIFDYVFKSDETEFEQSAFTFLDCMVNDPKLSDKFISLRAEYIHENIISFDEYLTLDSSATKNKLPFVLLTDKNNRYYKVIPDASLLQAGYSCLNDWRTLQSLSNLNRPKEVETVQQEIPEIIKEKQPTNEEISRNAVNNILARLISGDLDGKPLAAEVEPVESTETENAASLVESAAKDVITKKAELNEASSEIIDPYIDTPLCTSCNDCININSMMFAYDDNMQAIIKDVSKGSFKQLVMAAEKCPAEIIHPGKPKDPKEKDLDKLIKRAEKFNML